MTLVERFKLFVDVVAAKFKAQEAEISKLRSAQGVGKKEYQRTQEIRPAFRPQARTILQALSFQIGAIRLQTNTSSAWAGYFGGQQAWRCLSKFSFSSPNCAVHPLISTHAIMVIAIG